MQSFASLRRRFGIQPVVNLGSVIRLPVASFEPEPESPAVTSARRDLGKAEAAAARAAEAAADASAAVAALEGELASAGLDGSASLDKLTAAHNAATSKARVASLVSAEANRRLSAAQDALWRVQDAAKAEAVAAANKHLAELLATVERTFTAAGQAAQTYRDQAERYAQLHGLGGLIQHTMPDGLHPDRITAFTAYADAHR